MGGRQEAEWPRGRGDPLSAESPSVILVDNGEKQHLKPVITVKTVCVYVCVCACYTWIRVCVGMCARVCIQACVCYTDMCAHV